MIDAVPIVGFAPDLPQDTPGVIASSSAILPTIKGVGNGVGVTSSSSSNITGPACGGAYLTTLAGTGVRAFIGIAAKIYELNSSTPTDVSGKAYSASSTDPWSFAQFGSVSLAINRNDTLQKSTAALGAFADVSGAPKGNIVITAGPPTANFAMVFDYNDGTHYQDGIFWSALSDYTNWTPSIATECGNIRLLDINGRITAAIPYRDGVVAFKSNAMYLGTYVGPPAIWQWQRISSDVGCIGRAALCEVNDRIYFADSNGLWVYDGSYPRPMQGAVHQWWADSVATGTTGFTEYIRLTWDKTHNQIWFGYGFPGSTQYIVYNTRSQRWTNYGTLGSADSTMLVGELYDVAHAATVTPSTKFVALSRSAAAIPTNSFRMAAKGSTYGMVTFRSCRPEFTIAPSDTATGWVAGTLYSNTSLRNIASGTADTMVFTAPGRFDYVRTARFIAPQLTFTTGYQWECSAILSDLDVNQAGE